MTFELSSYLQEKREVVNAALHHYLDDLNGTPPHLAEALRYSLEAGGKRLRPILTLAACRLSGGEELCALPTACALEIIHTYSLIHDDLPAMDNDDLRRGQPTSHKKFGEATAILAGDALLTEAFAIMTQKTDLEKVTPETLIAVMGDIANAAGSSGMAGGQYLDLQSEGKKITLTDLEQLDRYKTGKLIEVSVTSGAKLAGADHHKIKALSTYGREIGFSFQIADDILNVEGNQKNLGKASGSDALRAKATYPTLMGLNASKKKAQELADRACAALEDFGEDAEALRQIAHFIVQRTS